MDAKEVVAHEPQNAPYLPSQDDFGPSVDLDAVAEDLGEAFFDELSAGLTTARQILGWSMWAVACS